jgi:hypothetical protein
MNVLFILICRNLQLAILMRSRYNGHETRPFCNFCPSPRAFRRSSGPVPHSSKNSTPGVQIIFEKSVNESSTRRYLRYLIVVRPECTKKLERDVQASREEADRSREVVRTTDVSWTGAPSRDACALRCGLDWSHAQARLACCLGVFG